MSTLHKVKAYFGMAPMEDYDDEYYDDRAPSRGYARPRSTTTTAATMGATTTTRAAIHAVTCAVSRPTIHHRDIAAGTRTNHVSGPGSSTARR